LGVEQSEPEDLVMEPSSDAVDLLLEQWAKQRPDLDARPMAVITRIARVSRMLQQALKAHLAYQARLLSGLGTTNQQRLAALLRRLAVTLGDGRP
jgi:hypothetical protein